MSALCGKDQAAFVDFVGGGVIRLDGKYSIDYVGFLGQKKGKTTLQVMLRCYTNRI